VTFHYWKHVLVKDVYGWGIVRLNDPCHGKVMASSPQWTKLAPSISDHIIPRKHCSAHRSDRRPLIFYVHLSASRILVRSKIFLYTFNHSIAAVFISLIFSWKLWFNNNKSVHSTSLLIVNPFEENNFSCLIHYTDWPACLQSWTEFFFFNLVSCY